MNWNPIDILRNRIDNLRAHPFQSIASGAAGFFGGPIAGELANRGFDRYNNWRTDQMVNNFTNDTTGSGIDQTGNDIWSRPLNGPLGQFDDANNDNSRLAQALMGNGGGGQPGMGGYNYGLNYGNNYGQGQTSNTPWTQQGNPNGILDFLGPAPPPSSNSGNGGSMGGPGSGMGLNPLDENGDGHVTPQERRDGANSGIGGFHAGGPMGVTNFMVGGMPVINGNYNTGDPNQAYYRGPGGMGR